MDESYYSKFNYFGRILLALPSNLGVPQYQTTQCSHKNLFLYPQDTRQLWESIKKEKNQQVFHS